MGVKEQVMAYLQAADSDGLESLVRQDRRVVRHLVGRLWDTGGQNRELVSRALGAAAAAHPDLGTEVARRLVWALNDEAAMNGVYGLPALAEMACQAPRVMGPFVGPFSSFLWDDGLRSEILRSLERIADCEPQLLGQAREALQQCAKTENPEERRRIAALLDSIPGDCDAT
jgi:hypothetical protein